MKYKVDNIWAELSSYSSIQIFNLLIDLCHSYALQILRLANNDTEGETPDLPWALARPSKKSNPKADLRRNISPKYKIDELNEPPPRSPGIRALLPLPGGDLLTGGTDLKIRRWEHSRFLCFLYFL